jgi:hypothetical protein
MDGAVASIVAGNRAATAMSKMAEAGATPYVVMQGRH